MHKKIYPNHSLNILKLFFDDFVMEQRGDCKFGQWSIKIEEAQGFLLLVETTKDSYGRN